MPICAGQRRSAQDTKPKTSPPRLPRTRKRFVSIRTMRSRSPADRSPLPPSPDKPRRRRRCATASIRRERMPARRSRWRRIWPWPTLRSANVAETGILDFTQASDAYERALALAPGNAQVLRISGRFAAYMGHFDVGVAAARRAVVLDPLVARSSDCSRPDAICGAPLSGGGRRLWQKSSVSIPTSRTPTGCAGSPTTGSVICRARALHARPSRDYWGNQYCLAVTYDRLGRHADAEAELTKMKAAVAVYRGLPVRDDLCAVGRSGPGARMARDGSARARSGPGAAEDRPAPGSLAPGAALPGHRAGVEVSDLSVAFVPSKTVPISHFLK